jgi:protein transport protein YIF1
LFSFVSLCVLLTSFFICPPIQTESYSRKWAAPRQDYNAPDLYIPLMAFMTYVLLSGLGKGLGSTGFTPDVIIQAIWRCLLLHLIETGLIKFGVNLMSVPIPFLDVFSYTGYKYVALCLNLISRVLGSTVSFLVSLFTASMLAYFVLKTMAAVVPPATTTGPPRHLLLLGFAALQFVVIITLSWL